MASFGGQQSQQQAPQATQQMPMKWGGGGGNNGPYIEKPEERAKWRALFEGLRGEVGAEVDLRVRLKGIKTPAEVHGWDSALNKRVLKYPNDKGTQGCRITLEVTQQGVAPDDDQSAIAGIRFFPDGAASLFPTTALAKVIAACAGRKFAEDETVNPYEYLERDLILTIALGKPVAPKDDNSHLNKAGHYWNLRGYRQIPVKASFGQRAAQAPEAREVTYLTNPPENGGSTVAVKAAAPRADDLDDLSDVPF